MLYHNKLNNKNCRTFYDKNQQACMYGDICLFRHEHRSFVQLHRHYYTSQLYTLESLIESAKSPAELMEAYQPVTKRLPLFCDITADDANSEDEWSSEDDSEALNLV